MASAPFTLTPAPAPDITVLPNVEDLPDGPETHLQRASLYLDITSGTLQMVKHTWNNEKTRPEQGMWEEAFRLSRQISIGLPKVIKWGVTVENWDSPEDYERFPETILPLIRTIVENILYVEEIGVYDLTAAGANAALEINRLARGNKKEEVLWPAMVTGDEYPDGPVQIRYVDAIDHMPLEIATDDRLHTFAEPGDGHFEFSASELVNTILFGPRTPGAKHYGFGRSGGLAGHMEYDYDADVQRRIFKSPELEGVRVAGILAWLYAYRRHVMGDIRTVIAREWFASNGYPDALTADTMGSELDSLTAEAEKEGLAQGVRLLDTWQALNDRRTLLRNQLREQLRKDGQTVKRLEEQLSAARARRTSRLMSVISWGGKESDADLGELSGMTKQRVQQLRQRITGDDADASEE